MVTGQQAVWEKLTILYGSETGNCQDLAKIVAWTVTAKVRKASQSLAVQVMPCDDYPIEQLPEERLVLFICSTTGVGEEPQNMKRFWRLLLRRDLPSDSLSQLSFAVIGLGDSSYLKYNFVAKKLHKRLLNLGANSLLELALGDDQHDLGPYVKIDPWLQEFYSQFVLHSPEGNAEEDHLIEPSFSFDFLDDELNKSASSKNEESPSSTTKFDELTPYEATVVANDRVTAEQHFQDVRLLGLAIEEPFRYKLGDVCSVYPENSDQDVETFLAMFKDERLLGGDSSRRRFLMTVRQGCSSWIAKSSYYYHLLRHRNPCSVFELVKRYMDINSIPKRSFFHLFHRFSQNDLERDLLRRFALGTDLDELYEYVNRPKRSILEVMADFPHTSPHVPFHYLLDLIPAICARPYSVASTPATSAHQVDLLYAVVNYRTRLRKPRLGLCTNWLASRTTGDRVRIFLRPSNFALPADHADRPLVMVGAGTGVAPFRAFIHHRAQEGIPANWLFFGCRYQDQDYYLAEEWKQLAERTLLTVFEAFSRQNPDQSKVYVQNRLVEQRELVFRLLIQENGLLWVAGKSQQYPQLVREAIADILKHQMDGDDKQVDDLISRLELRKRIQFECW